MSEKVAIVMSTFNNADIIEKNILSYLAQNQCNDPEHNYKHHAFEVHIFIADDGSTDATVEILSEMSSKFRNIHVIKLPHGERGIARKEAIALAESFGPDYLVIMDADMKMKLKLVESCLAYFKENQAVGALVIPEIAYSEHKNFMSQVKVFERNCLNNLGVELGNNSIEAARFWRIDAYKQSGGINFNQIAFEETQPTIRYIEQGGLIKRAHFTGVWHDEKHVTLKTLLSKKKYYFSKMNKTIEAENNGLLKTIQRWYFFRPVLYKKENLINYLCHPVLTLGMVFMYVALTFIGVWEIALSKLKLNSCN